ncbi:hypothetical protein Tco_1469370 [Tanacetum coccineum]
MPPKDEVFPAEDSPCLLLPYPLLIHQAMFPSQIPRNQRIPQSPAWQYLVYLEAPPSPDYVPGPKEPEQAPLLPEFVPKPVYQEFMPPEDEVFPAKEQPLPAAVSPTTDSPGCIAESDQEEDEEDPEKDLTNYPADRGDDNDDDDESFDDDEDDDDDDESSDDDDDDDDDVEDDDDEEEEEEEHLAPVESVPPPVHHIARLLDIPSPSPSPLSPWSSPLPQIPSPALPQIPSPPLLVSLPVPVSPPPLPASPTYPLGYRAAMIRQRAESPSTSHSLLLPPSIILSHTRASVAMMRAAAPSTYILASRSETPPSGTPPLLPIPLPIPSLHLLLPFTDRRADRTEVCLPPQKRLCIALGLRADYGFVATLDREIRRDTERDVGYGITDTWDEMLEGMPGAPTTNETELGRRMTNFVTTVRQDTNESYGRPDKAQEARAVLSGRLNLLGRDRRSYAYTALLMEREARLSREAWGWSMDASDTTHSEVEALRTTVLAQQIEIVALRAADRARQAQLIETLRLMSTLQTYVTTL